MDDFVTDTFETKSRILVRIRPLLPPDAPYLIDIFEHMSADSRYRRFHQPVDQLPPERVKAEAEYIAHLSPQIGFIAFADLPDEPDAPVGAVRCVCVGEAVAETAVSVRDDMQSQGIGSHLLALLAAEARRQGVRKLVATIQNSNKPIVRVLKRLPYVYTRRIIGSESQLELDLMRSKEAESSAAVS
ncbi:MAG: GNAT family N-acetyltransferase [Anaerolineae bacterium]